MKLFSQLAIIFFIIAACNFGVIFGNYNVLDKEEIKDFDLTTEEVIKKHGYPVETHTVASEDGYRLVLHRIPHGKLSLKVGLPILVTHSAIGSSEQFVAHGKDSLGFILADKGYDVWFLNFRGNVYSKDHNLLSSNDSKFWDFSLQELGAFDLPASIDYIRNNTKNDDVFYLGYSMGATAFLIMGSERPEYQSHIRGAVLLGPLTTMKDTKLPFALIAPFANVLKVLNDIKTRGKFFVDSTGFRNVVEKICSFKKLPTLITACKRKFFNAVVGALSPFDELAVRRFLSPYPSSTSSKVIVHYSQLFLSGKFLQYDYGLLNMKMYKNIFPPKYNLHTITVPISMFVAPKDNYGTPKSVLETLKDLPNVRAIHLIPDKTFEHKDFMLGDDNENSLYPDIIKEIDSLIQDNGNVLKVNVFKKFGEELFKFENSDLLNGIGSIVHGIFPSKFPGEVGKGTENLFKGSANGIGGSLGDTLEDIGKKGEGLQHDIGKGLEEIVGGGIEMALNPFGKIGESIEKGLHHEIKGMENVVGGGIELALNPLGKIGESIEIGLHPETKAVEGIVGASIAGANTLGKIGESLHHGIEGVGSLVAGKVAEANSLGKIGESLHHGIEGVGGLVAAKVAEANSLGKIGESLHHGIGEVGGLTGGKIGGIGGLPGGKIGTLGLIGEKKHL